MNEPESLNKLPERWKSNNYIHYAEHTNKGRQVGRQAGHVNNLRASCMSVQSKQTKQQHELDEKKRSSRWSLMWKVRSISNSNSSISTIQKGLPPSFLNIQCINIIITLSPGLIFALLIFKSRLSV